MPAVLPFPRLLTDGLTMVESGRWHEGRLWFAHWGSGEVIAVDLHGRREVVGPGRDGMGWSIAWLPDGRLLVSGEELTRVEPDGSAVQHSPYGGNELVVDPAGHIYVVPLLALASSAVPSRWSSGRLLAIGANCPYACCEPRPAETGPPPGLSSTRRGG